MKKVLLIIAVTLSVASIKGQPVGIGTANIHNSAVLELASTSKGFLPPRLTTIQRNSIVNAVTGLLVYDTDLNALMHFNGTQWRPVGGSVGSFNLPFAANVSSSATAPFSIAATSSGSAIKGTAAASFTAALEGNADGGVGSYGVLGQATHTTGTGIAGVSANASAVYGFSSNGGTALRGIATGGGYSLKTRGNLRITGGNTNPQPNAVLTCIDADGNAVWKKPLSELAFGLAGSYSSFSNLTNNTLQKLHFGLEQYDYSNTCVPTTSASPTPGMSSFVAPVSGIYEFNISVGVRAAAGQVLNRLEAQLVVNRAGNVFDVYKIESNNMYPGNENQHQVQGDTQCRLQAGDIVYVNIRQTNNTSSAVTLIASNDITFWGGHLVFVD
jgi:hypothetical protein